MFDSQAPDIKVIADSDNDVNLESLANSKHLVEHYD